MKKSNVFLIIVTTCLIISLAIHLKSFLNREISDKRYEEILQAIISNPNAVELRHEEQDITSSFIEKYKKSIENEDYSEAIDFLKENDIGITIHINSKNEFIIDGVE